MKDDLSTGVPIAGNDDQRTPGSSGYGASLRSSGATTPAAEDWERARRLGAAWLSEHTPATAAAYAADLRTFFGYCEDIGTPPLACGRTELNLFRAHLLGPGGLSAKTTARKLTALSGYFAWATEEGLLDKNPMLRVKRPRLSHEPPPQVLDLDDIAALLAAARRHSPRADVLCSLLLLNALRISEITGSNVEGLSWERGHRTLRVTCKNSKVMRIALAEPTVRAIESYLGERSQGPLLLSRTGRRLDRSNAARLLTAVGRLALPTDKADRLHPHLCRHAAITAFLDSGATLRDTQDAAGHASASQTRAYDDNRHALDRSPTYLLAQRLAGGDLAPP